MLASAGLVAVSFAGDDQAATVASFLSALADSGWLPRVLSEYGVRDVQYEGQVTLATPPSASTTDVEIQALLTSGLADGTIPVTAAANASLVYVVIVPSGVSILRAGSDACGGIPGSGYHDSTDGSGPSVPYVVVPSCDPPFSAILSAAAGMDLEAARLLADTLTDPAPRSAPAYALTDPSNPWTTMGTEVGDFCWGRLTSEGAPATVQRVWSNVQIAAAEDPCAPLVTDAVDFGISAAPAVLQVVHVQTPFTVTVTGWSAAPLGAWTVLATPWIGAVSDDDQPRRRHPRERRIDDSPRYAPGSRSRGHARNGAPPSGSRRRRPPRLASGVCRALSTRKKSER